MLLKILLYKECTVEFLKCYRLGCVCVGGGGIGNLDPSLGPVSGKILRLVAVH